METKELIGNLYLEQHLTNNLVVFREDRQGKEQYPIFVGHYGTCGVFAGFSTLEQYQHYIKEYNIDIDYFSKRTNSNPIDGITEIFRCMNDFYTVLFWNINDLPQNCKKIKALSNGSIVDCYYLKNGKDIIMFRPNPNAKELYKPLPIKEHIEHSNKFGTI
jgi:hypothetical protein